MKTDVDSDWLRALPARGSACARAAFLVSPEAAHLASQSAADNAYMQLHSDYSLARAQQQHRELQRALSAELPVISFCGRSDTPDDMFPNNVFATHPGRLILGRMHHPVRQREAERTDIAAFFTQMLGYSLSDLRSQPGDVELTGSMIVDRARGVGFAGIGERCATAGAEAFACALDLHACLCVPLASGEYHLNVVMSLLAGRMLVICPEGFAHPADAERIAACYAPHVLYLTPPQKSAFAANCLSLREDSVWMSEHAVDSLTASQRGQLQRSGFALRTVALDEIEKAGGSLRCCVAEIF